MAAQNLHPCCIEQHQSTSRPPLSFADAVRCGPNGPDNHLARPWSLTSVSPKHCANPNFASASPTLESIDWSSNIGLHRSNKLDPFKAHNGEELPSGFLRSYSGFLVKESIEGPEIDPQGLTSEVTFLRDHMLIVSFIGEKPPAHFIVPWLTLLNQVVSPGKLIYKHDAGLGFFYLKADSPDTAKRAMMLTPFRIQWGTAVIQSWIPALNPSSPIGLKLPTWVTLKQLPLEYAPSAHLIAQGLGEVLGVGQTNEFAKFPRFCVAMDVERGWIGSISLKSLDPRHKVTVLVDYDNAPIRCRYCLATTHCVRDCQELHKRRPPGQSRDFTIRKRFNSGEAATRPQRQSNEQHKANENLAPSIDLPNLPVADPTSDKGKRVAQPGENNDGFTLVIHKKTRNMSRGQANSHWRQHPIILNPGHKSATSRTNPQVQIAPRPNKPDDQGATKVKETNDLSEVSMLPTTVQTGPKLNIEQISDRDPQSSKLRITVDNQHPGEPHQASDVRDGLLDGRTKSNEVDPRIVDQNMTSKRSSDSLVRCSQPQQERKFTRNSNHFKDPSIYLHCHQQSTL